MNFMKNINYIINGVLAVAVIVLFVLHFTGKKESGAVPALVSAEGGITGALPVAYVNMDSLLQNYNYSKDLNEIIMRKEENARASVNQQATSLQSEAQDFQRKLANNAFLTRERAEQEQQRLLKKQQELEAYDNRLTQELMTEHQKLTEQLRDSLVAQLKIFNREKNFQIIFSNIANDNILLSEDVYDITAELILYLNKNYSPSTPQQ
jgi:outer membrane protein